MINPPDYSQYISAMTQQGYDLTGKGGQLFDWAKGAGVGLDKTASTVGSRAGQIADTAAGTYPGMMATWQNTYGPLYQAQADDARRMINDLPNTEERYAGKNEADVGQAFDASKASLTRKLQSQGLSMPSIGSTALDTQYAGQRAAAQVAGAEAGRLQARTEARGVTSGAINTGLQIPQVAQGSASTAFAGGQQQIGAPESAVSTTAGAYSPSLGYYSSAFPYLSQWGSTMSNSYNQSLAQFNSEQNSGGGTGALLGAGLGLAGTVAGAYFGGPAGASVGGAAGRAAAGAIYNAEGGMISPGTVVPPGASPSGGAQTDDVAVDVNGAGGAMPSKGAINVGEFIWPKDVVSWRGEQWMQKEVLKARKERQEQTVAAPTMAPPGAGAIQTHRPMQGAPA